MLSSSWNGCSEGRECPLYKKKPSDPKGGSPEVERRARTGKAGFPPIPSALQKLPARRGNPIPLDMLWDFCVSQVDCPRFRIPVNAESGIRIRHGSRFCEGDVFLLQEVFFDRRGGGTLVPPPLLPPSVPGDVRFAVGCLCVIFWQLPAAVERIIASCGKGVSPAPPDPSGQAKGVSGREIPSFGGCRKKPFPGLREEKGEACPKR